MIDLQAVKEQFDLDDTEGIGWVNRERNILDFFQNH